MQSCKSSALIALFIVTTTFSTSIASAQQSSSFAKPATVSAPAKSATIPANSSQSLPTQQMPAQAPPTVPEARSPSLKISTGLLTELSPWSMFLSADLVVKLVMIGLAFASLVTWTTFIAKMIQLHLARQRLSVALSRISKAKTLSGAQVALGSTHNVLLSLLAAGIQELRMSVDSVVEGGIKERAASMFSEITRVEMRSVRRGIGVLATIGATSPFVGLFGTVWGIMNSFIGISKAQTTNLAVVAPGIAEALLATAIGLVAAIPAVVMYNHLSRSAKGYSDLVNRASGQVGRLLSRDLDRSHGKVLSRAAE